MIRPEHDQTVEQQAVSPRWMDARKRHPHREPTPLALTIDHDSLSPGQVLTVAQWSEAAHNHLREIATTLAQAQPRQSLPLVSLRGRLNVADQRLLRFEYDLGLSQRTLLWTRTDVSTSRTDINDAVLQWSINDLATPTILALAGNAIEQLKQLARKKAAVETYPRQTTPFHWGTSLSKTAKALHPASYADLADYVALHLEGQCVFPELPGLRRIVGNELESNQAELMTEPLSSGRNAAFSLVVRIRVVSYPGRSLPIVVIEFTRRTWTRELKEQGGTRTVSGYAFLDGSTRVLRFTVRKRKQDDGKWVYTPDRDFSPIERRYFAGQKMTVATILQEGFALTPCKLLIGQKHGTGKRGNGYSGVPDLDKMEAFGQITKFVEPLGLRPWYGLTPIATSSKAVQNYGQYWRNRTSTKAEKLADYERWLEEIQASIRACYHETHHVVIAVQTGIEADAQEAEKRLQAILPHSLLITRIPLPQNVHGPRSQLPGSQLVKPAERAALRVAAWSPLVESVKYYEQQSGRKVDGILVLAREWYPDNAHDDRINKRAGRIALARGVGVPVQYVLPREEFRENPNPKSSSEKAKSPEQIEAEIGQEFETRLMVAWLDLAFKSLGRVRPGKLLNELHTIYADATLGTVPDRVLALGVLRRNSTRTIANEPAFLPYAIELDIEQGTCSASIAYEDPVSHLLTWSDTLPLPQALVRLASLGTVQLASAKKDRQKILAERTQEFFKNRLVDFSKRSLHPIIIIDADTSRSAWPWLQDKDIDPTNVHLAGGFNAQVAWSHARLVRIRTDNSPKVLWDQEFSGNTSDTNETIHYHAPRWAEAALFKLNDTVNTSVYLSFGSEIRTGRIKGRSSYREIPGMEQKKDGEKKRYAATMMQRFDHNWATPSGVEIVVVRPEHDHPDQIARFIEWLRQCYVHIGPWTSKPAPTFFATALKEYLPDYAIDEEENEREQEEIEGGEE